MIAAWLDEMESKRDEVLDLDKMSYKILGDDASAASKKIQRKLSSQSVMLSNCNENSAGVLEVVSSVRKMENGKE